MSLEMEVDSVEMVNGTDLAVSVTVSAPGADTTQHYDGSVSTSNVPESDAVSLLGRVPATGDDSFQVILTTGYSMDDLPAGAFVTVVVEDGEELLQEQFTVELQPDGGIPWAEVAVGGVALGGLAFGVRRLRN